MKILVKRGRMIDMVSEILKKYFGELDIQFELDRQYINNKIEINPEICILCDRCLEICPVNAISSTFPEVPYIDDKCVYCNTCVETCPVDAIKITKTRVKVENGNLIIENRLKSENLEYNRQKCVMCLVCSKNCPFGAISESDDKISFDMEKCVLCGHCEKICPAKAIKLE